MSDRELPGALSELVGLEVLDYDCLWGTDLKVRWGNDVFTAEKWSDIITLKGAAPLAVCASEFYAGSPAVTVNAYGDGLAYYVGNEPGVELMDRLAQELVQRQVSPAFVKQVEGRGSDGAPQR